MARCVCVSVCVTSACVCVCVVCISAIQLSLSSSLSLPLYLSRVFPLCERVGMGLIRMHLHLCTQTEAVRCTKKSHLGMPGCVGLGAGVVSDWYALRPLCSIGPLSCVQWIVGLQVNPMWISAAARITHMVAAAVPSVPMGTLAVPLRCVGVTDLGYTMAAARQVCCVCTDTNAWPHINVMWL